MASSLVHERRSARRARSTVA